jgi:hypothetical protein
MLRLMASTPAINVVATAPIPGIRMPSLPSAGSIFGVGLADVSCVLDKEISSPVAPQTGIEPPRHDFERIQGFTAIRYDISP